MLKKILQLIVILLMITPGVMAQTVSIENAVEAPGPIAVQVDMTGISGVEAITLYIGFDQNVMSFTGISNTQIPGGWVANATSGIIKIVYTTGFPGTGYTPTGKLLDLNFNYLGGFSSDLTFVEASCEITSGLTPVVPTYTNGSVVQIDATGSVSLTSQIAPIGNSVTMPLNMTGDGFDQVDDFTYIIAFDEAQLDFTGLTDGVLNASMVTANNANGVLTLAFNATLLTGPFDFTAASPLLNLHFVYLGGTAAVDFQPGSMVLNNQPMYVPVEYTNATVTPDPTVVPALTIDGVPGTPGSPVSVPVIATGFGSSQLGGITLNISFDDSLTYTGFSNGYFPGMLVSATSNNTLTIVWSNQNNTTLLPDDAVLLNLNFIFGHAEGGHLSPVTFDPASLLESVNLVNVPVTFIDGFVDLAYTVSGQLTYMGDNLRPIGTSGTSTTTVYLKNTADSTVAYTAATDASGNYTFTEVFAGNYFLDATTDIDATLSYDVTDALVIFGIGGTLTGLEAIASDVNLADGVDVTDAFIVYGSWLGGNVKVPAWIAPDWFFDNQVVVVTTDLTGEDFSGICSGDANGDFVPVP